MPKNGVSLLFIRLLSRCMSCQKEKNMVKYIKDSGGIPVGKLFYLCGGATVFAVCQKITAPSYGQAPQKLYYFLTGRE